jgi:hypothetical protein
MSGQEGDRIVKGKNIGILAGLGLLLASTGAAAHTDVYVDLGLGYAPPRTVVVEERPVYYYDDYPSERVYYEYYDAPRRYYYAPRVHADSRWHERHDRGWHRRHHRH